MLLAAAGCESDSDDPHVADTDDRAECQAAADSCGYSVWYCNYGYDPYDDEPYDAYTCARDGDEAAALCGTCITTPNNTQLCLEDIDPAACVDNAYATDGAPDWVPSRHVSYDSQNDVYVIDATFFDDVIADPRQLLWDSAVVEPKNPYFKLKNIASGDLADALGLENGDKLISLNSTLLKHDVDISHAYNDFQNDTQFTLEVYNWSLGGTRTLYYEVR